MKVRKANFNDFENIKSLMLTALQSDPKAFSASYQEYVTNSETWWRNYLSDYLIGIYSHLYFAEDNGEIIGMIGLNFFRAKKSQHTTDLVWLFVKNEKRGKGVGSKLLKYIDEIITTQHKEILKISLTVVSTQTQAIELYKKNNYSVSGNKRRHIKSDNEFYDLILMEKHLDS